MHSHTAIPSRKNLNQVCSEKLIGFKLYYKWFRRAVMPVSKINLLFSWKMLLLYGIAVICIITDKDSLFRPFQNVHDHMVNDYKYSQNPTRAVRAQYSKEVSSKAQKGCPKKHFKTFQMKSCLKWLECNEIEKMVMVAKQYKKLGAGSTKKVYRVPWKDHQMYFALSVITDPNRPEQETQRINRVNRLEAGTQNLLNFQPSHYVVQVAGVCKTENMTVFLTEDCSTYGSLEQFVLTHKILTFTAIQRLDIVIQLIECLVFLHYKSGPPKVHCDLHNPLQSLRQFLLTDDRRVVLGDLDELPIDDPKNNFVATCRPEIHCQMSNGTFLAPEQRYDQKSCRKKLYNIATIKADTWKIPGISYAILNETFPHDDQLQDVKKINLRLAYIHKKCHKGNIHKRANSSWILEQYKLVKERLIHHSNYLQKN